MDQRISDIQVDIYDIRRNLLLMSGEIDTEAIEEAVNEVESELQIIEKARRKSK